MTAAASIQEPLDLDCGTGGDCAPLSGSDLPSDHHTRIEYYVVPPGRQARNSGIFVMYGRWPVESLAMRHLIGHRHYFRAANPEERELQRTNKRYIYVRYETLEALIEDEIRVVGREAAQAIHAALEPICTRNGYRRNDQNNQGEARPHEQPERKDYE